MDIDIRQSIKRLKINNCEYVADTDTDTSADTAIDTATDTATATTTVAATLSECKYIEINKTADERSNKHSKINIKKNKINSDSEVNKTNDDDEVYKADDKSTIECKLNQILNNQQILENKLNILLNNNTIDDNYNYNKSNNYFMNYIN